MSKDNVKQMFGKMEKDTVLKGKYVELMQASQKDAENKMAEKLIEFGKISGFEFSKDDLLAARVEIMDKLNSSNELSDGDLANVAGGAGAKTHAIVQSVFSFGVACVITSLININNEGGCGGKLSTTRECPL